MLFTWYTVLLCSSICSGNVTPMKHSETQELLKQNDGSLKRQSPINILTQNIENIDLPPLKNPFKNQKNEKEQVICTNSGITGDPLKDEYIFHDIHFHWGEVQLKGSEHILNGHGFASELHAVFYNQKYQNLMEAMKKPDGLVVLAWFGVASENDSQEMHKIFEVIEDLTEYGAEHGGSFKDILGFLVDLAGPISGKSDWVTYFGALTTPPYPENVIWIIFNRPYLISQHRLNLLRYMKKKDGTLNIEHSKKVAPINGRVIYKPKDGIFEADELKFTEYALP